MKALRDLIRPIPVMEIIGPVDRVITGLSYHTGTIDTGHLFFACDGIHTDGHRYIDKAVDSGAAAIVHSKPVTPRNGITYIRIENPRFHMATIASEYFGHPSRSLDVAGITGTNGKSTTAFFCAQLLAASGRRTGLISSASVKIADAYEKNTFGASTPEAIEVQSLLRRIADAGNKFAIVEATSHGLSDRNNRLGSIDFNAAVFTNLTHEHLEFHGSMDQYLSDKANLFRFLDASCKAAPFGVVNAAAPQAEYIRSSTKAPVLSYRVMASSEDIRNTTGTDIAAGDVRTGLEGSRFRLFFSGAPETGVEATIPAPGVYNVENALAAILTVAGLTNTGFDEWLPYLPGLTGVPGRMHPVNMGQLFSVYVDFAHSPDAFERVLPFARGWTHGNLIIVFGSAGERDLGKRSIQGEIADRFADCIILADEDPRSEDPMKILEDIASGCVRHTKGENLLLIPDRREAITKACSIAKEGDTVLLLGKGHESSIEYRDGKIEWNEVREAEAALGRLGYQ